MPSSERLRREQLRDSKRRARSLTLFIFFYLCINLAESDETSTPRRRPSKKGFFLLKLLGVHQKPMCTLLAPVLPLDSPLTQSRPKQHIFHTNLSFFFTIL